MTTITKLISQSDIKEVIRVHNSAFEGFFLTELGSDFLLQYYKSLASSSDGVLIGAYQNSRLIGFCAACTKSAGFNSKLIKDNIIAFCIIGIKLLLTRPGSLYRLFKNLSKTGDTDDDGKYAELMSIAVDKGVQNSGAGKLLVTALESYLKAKNIDMLSLTTDKHNNFNTLQFYKKRGFEEMYEFITYPNREMYRLIKKL